MGQQAQIVDSVRTAVSGSQAVAQSLQPTTSLPFDCDADFTTCEDCLTRRWSPAKLLWCCAHSQRGCKPTVPMTAPPTAVAVSSSAHGNASSASGSAVVANQTLMPPANQKVQPTKAMPG